MLFFLFPPYLAGLQGYCLAVAIAIVEFRGLCLVGVIQNRVFAAFWICVDFAVQVICVPYVEGVFFVRRVVHGSHEKSCVLVTVWKSGDVYAAAFSVRMSGHMHLVVGLFEVLRVPGRAVDIVLYFSEFEAGGAAFGDELAT